MTRTGYEKMYMPVRISPVVLNVNTLSNKHFYYTTLFKPVEYYKHDVMMDDLNHGLDFDFSTSSMYSFRKNLDDFQLLKIYEEFYQNGWKLCDLKAYKNKDNVVKFSAVWSSLQEFYEGTSVFYVGLDKSELVSKINAMNPKKMYPKILTNYGLLNASGEHVYAVLFCQF
jgi:hypothetical protein